MPLTDAEIEWILENPIERAPQLWAANHLAMDQCGSAEEVGKEMRSQLREMNSQLAKGLTE